jgi:hypothetical protein
MERYHATYLTGDLEITGWFQMSGPQAVGDSGVPEYIAEIFRNNSKIDTIAIQYEKNSVIYRRMNE